jgi:hypothetical protein
VALIALFDCIFTLIVAFVLSKRVDKALLAVILYASGLTILWSFSLRGNLVDGYDVAAEYYTMNQTTVTGIWHAVHPVNSYGAIYGAMLSDTVLPTELHALSGVPIMLMLSAVYPAIFALFPVAIFSLAGRILARRWAFAAAAFTIGQYYFSEIIGFARTEIAFMFFVALIGAMVDRQIPRRSQWAWIGLLGLALAVSHYSTTYLAISIIGLMLLLQWVASRFREIPCVSGAVVVAFSAAIAGAVIWYGPITYSSSNLTQFIHTLETQGLDVLPNRVRGESLLSVYLSGNTSTPMQAAQYAKLVHNYYAANLPYVKPLPDAGLRQYVLRDSAPAVPPVKWNLGFSALNLGEVLVEQLAYLPILLGALLMVLRRRCPLIVRQVGLLTLATVLLLTLTRFSGTLATAYGAARAILQGMPFLAITLCWAAQTLVRRWQRGQATILVVTVACLAVILANTSSLVGAMLGGGTTLNLTNNGEDFEQHYVTAPDLASARWLGWVVRPGQLVYADEYGQLPLDATTQIIGGVIPDVTPLTLNDHAWVYASRTNVIDQQAYVYYGERFVSYVFPVKFLNANFNLVYTNGSSEVFYR